MTKKEEKALEKAAILREKQRRWVYDVIYEDLYISGELDRAIDQLIEIRESYKDKYESIVLDLELKHDWYDSVYPQLRVTGNRKETDAELDKRLKEEAERLRIQEAKELEKYKKLQAKFAKEGK